ncbi:PREDICTED: uncharacterized protein LOC104789160 [Camelina sativa]|uniref:Uncharacterized protein LOC104789160 n=1 Tax=Camelina sativa TaxID=90675 RepID=A0ABM0ZBD5_CAMSA|nr:PREDICTED: uncharacterized protein LOC104789160 [Camelina sativa]
MGINEILKGEEHSHYAINPVIPPGMQDFQDTVLVSDSWLIKYQQSFVAFEAGGCSDHLRGRIKLGADKLHIHKPFNFTNALTSDSGFIPMIKEFWDNTETLFHSMYAMFRFSKKLKALKPKIKMMSKDRLGNWTKKKKEAYAALCKCQLETMTNLTDLSMQAESAAYSRWLFVSGLEEKYLKQKSKLHWLKVGDGNNKVFHKAAKVRKVRNAIKEIHCPDDSVVTSPEGINQEAVRFFHDFLSHNPSHYHDITEEELKALLHYRCSEADGEQLEWEVSAE